MIGCSPWARKGDWELAATLGAQTDWAMAGSYWAPSRRMVGMGSLVARLGLCFVLPGHLDLAQTATWPVVVLLVWDSSRSGLRWP
jgi:hypothetical protein